MQRVILVMVSVFALYLLITDSSFEKKVGQFLRSSGSEVGSEAGAAGKDVSRSLFYGLESFRNSIGAKLISYRENLRAELPPEKKDTPITTYLMFFGVATLTFFFIYKVLFYGAILVIIYLIFNLIRYRQTY